MKISDLNGKYTVLSSRNIKIPDVPEQSEQPEQQNPTQETSTVLHSPDILGSAKEALNPVGSFAKDTLESAKSGVSQFGAGFNQTQSAAKSGDIQGLGRGALNMAAGGVSAIVSPFTAVAKQAAQIPGVSQTLDAVKKHIIDPASNAISDNKALQDFMVSNPNSDEIIGNLINVIGTVVGGAKAPEIKAAFSEGTEGLSSSLSDTVQKGKEMIVGNPEAKAATAEKKSFDSSVKNTMPLPSKDVRIEDLRNTLPDSANGKGGVTREGILGKSTSQPGEADIRRAEAAHPYIKDAKDPLNKIANVNQAIKDTSEKVLDPFLDKNPTPSNFEDMRNYVEQKNKPDVNIQKDPAAFEAYQRATDNALNTLYKTMKESAEKTGDFGPSTSGADIRKARIAIDQQISQELGPETFGTPQYKGIKAAEISVRNTINRLNEDLLRYPGQLENLNKMNQFVSEAEGRGIKVNLENPSTVESLERQFDLKKTPESEANAKFLADQHSKMSDLYDARDNMIDRYQSSVGKNKIQEAVKNNPAVKAGIGFAKRIIPFGIGNSL